MKIYLFFFLLLVGMPFCLKAQNISYFGEVKNDQNEPVEFANVVALDPDDQTIASFGVTGGEGKFKLILEEGKTYILKVTYVGYHPFELEIIATDNAKDPLLITLEATEIELDAAEVIYEMPVILSGDTLIYKADAFTNGRERKLKDVLEKLPGFEVDENGEVRVEGKKVDKLMVDGKDFFEGDTKMGTQNIPANVVDRVQLLQDYNEISLLKGLDDDENLALNILLKEDKKNMLFGDLTAGAGPKNRYFGHANVFYYAPKVNLNLITDANNVGELAFTMQDYFRFSGGLSGLSKRSGSSVSATPDDIGIPQAHRNNAVELENALAAVNFNFHPNPTWMHSGFLIGSGSDNQMGSISQRTYLRAAENNEEILISTNQVEQNSAILKYSATYIPKEESYLKYSLFGKLAHIQEESVQQSTFEGYKNSIQNGNSQTPYSVEQQFQAFHTPNEKNIFSVEAGFQYKLQDPFLDLMTTELPFNGFIPVIDQEQYHFLQGKNIITRTQEAVFNYYHILNPTNHLNFSLGNNWTRQHMDSQMQQVSQDGEQVEIKGADLFNEAEYDFQDLYIGISYKTRYRDLIISPGLNLHYFRVADQQSDQEHVLEKIMLLPSLYVKLQLRSTQSLTFNYKTEADFVDIQKLATGIVISDYNALFTGNRNLENGFYQRFRLNYNHFNRFKTFTVSGSLNYQRKMDEPVKTVNFSGLDRINSLMNVEAINESWTGILQGDKRFEKLKVKGEANFSAAETNNFVNNRPNLHQSYTQNYNMSITTTFFGKMDLEMGYELVYNDYRTNKINNVFVTERPFAKLNYGFLKGFMLTADYEYNRYQNKGTKTVSTFDFINASLAYQKDGSPWEFKTSIFNALNTQGIQRDSFNESLISTYQYFVQKRYLLFRIRFEL